MQQSMQISLLCSTEHKEENMIFINSPFAILDEAFRSLYPDKKYKACIEPSIKDDEGNRVFGFTQFSKGETPVIAISAELNIMDATEIFAHELAHVAAGEGAGHGERWDEEFQRIFDEYNRIGKERFGEDGKEIETAPEYRGGWIRSEDRMPEDDEDVLVWFEYFRFGEYQRLFQMAGKHNSECGQCCRRELHRMAAVKDRTRHQSVEADLYARRCRSKESGDQRTSLQEDREDGRGEGHNEESGLWRN